MKEGMEPILVEV